MRKTKEQNCTSGALSARKQKKLEKKEALYQQRYGISYIELTKKDKEKKAKIVNKQVFKKYWGKYKGELALFYVLLFFLSVIEVVPAVFYQKYIDSLTVAPPLWHTALMMAVGFCLVSLFGALLQRFSSYKIRRILNKVVLDMQNDICSKLMTAKFENYKNFSSGKLVNRINSDVNAYVNYVQEFLTYLCDIISSVIIAVYLFIIAPGLSGVIFALSFLITLSVVLFTNFVRKKQVKCTNLIGDNRMSLYNEALRGIYDVKLLNNDESLLSKIKENNKYQFVGNTDSLRSYRAFYSVVDVLMILRRFLVYALAIVFLQNEMVSFSTCIVVFSYGTSYIGGFFSKLQDMFEAKMQTNVRAERISEILDEQNFSAETFGDVSLSKIKGKIEFLDVSFAYKDDPNTPILDHLNFEIKPNECVGFVGASGAGKTTIASLIPRIYDATSGKICIDDVDVKDLDKNTLRSSISVVSQAPYIFNMSFKENLKMVKPDATDDEIVSVLKKSQLYDIVKSRPEGVDTLVGEGGVQLSGGQKQRLAIARALLKNSKILIFDEATSALDNQTQTEIQTVIKKLQKNHTIIIIAHRLSTIVDCDRLFFVKDGRVLTSGTHEELLNNCNEYKQMYYKVEDEI